MKLDMYEFCAVARTKKDCSIKSFDLNDRTILACGDALTEIGPCGDYDYRNISVGRLEDYRECDGYSYETADYIVTCIAETDEVVDIYFKDLQTFVKFDTGEIEYFGDLNPRWYRSCPRKCEVDEYFKKEA